MKKQTKDINNRKARAIAELIGVDRKHKLSTDMIETYILEYGQHIAKQQRKNCANNMPSRWETDSIGHEDLEDIDALIFFAPEPKFQQITQMVAHCHERGEEFRKSHNGENETHIS